MSTSEDALEVIRSMAGRWADDNIAASLNRMGLRTGQNVRIVEDDQIWTYEGFSIGAGTYALISLKYLGESTRCVVPLERLPSGASAQSIRTPRGLRLAAFAELTSRISSSQVAFLCFRAVWSHAGKKHIWSSRTLAAVCVLAPLRGTGGLYAGSRGGGDHLRR